MSLEKLLKIIESFLVDDLTGLDRYFVLSVEGTEKWITLSKTNLSRLSNYASLQGDKYVGTDPHLTNVLIFDNLC